MALIQNIRVQELLLSAGVLSGPTLPRPEPIPRGMHIRAHGRGHQAVHQGQRTGESYHGLPQFFRMHCVPDTSGSGKEE